MATQPTSRKFVKKVDGETKVRMVTSPQAEVQALFDGFREEGKSSGSGSGSSKSGSSSS